MQHDVVIDRFYTNEHARPESTVAKIGKLPEVVFVRTRCRHVSECATGIRFGEDTDAVIVASEQTVHECNLKSLSYATNSSRRCWCHQCQKLTNVQMKKRESRRNSFETITI